MNVKEYANKTELEFAFFKGFGDSVKIPEIEASEINPIYDYIHGFISWRDKKDFKFLKVLKQEENKVICFCPETEKSDYYVFQNVFGLIRDDIVLFIRDRYSGNGYALKKSKSYDGKILIPQGWLNKKSVDEFYNLIENSECENKNYIELFKEDLNELKDFNIPKDFIIDKLKEKIEEQLKEEEEQRREHERREKERQKENQLEQKKKEQSKESFKETGVFESDKVKVNGKKIDYGSFIYALDKEAKDVLDFEFLDRGWFDNDHWASKFNSIEETLLDKEVNFVKKPKLVNQSVEPIYSVEFLDRGVKVNGVKVNRARVRSILNKIEYSNKELSDKDIKILGKISNIKFKLLNLQKVEIAGVEVETEFSYVNNKTFNLKMFDKKKDFEWDYLKEIFGSGTNIREYISKHNFLMLIKELGLEKQKVYDILKRKTMIKKLKQGNESD